MSIKYKRFYQTFSIVLFNIRASKQYPIDHHVISRGPDVLLTT